MQDRTDKLLKKERNFVSNKQANKDSDYGKGPDPRFSPKRGKSKAVAKTISSKKQQRRFSKTIEALNRKGNPFSDHRFRTDRGKEAKELKKKGLKPVPPLRRRTPRAIAKGTAPRAIPRRKRNKKR
tara:strand:+ start:431 stop:808 length:378 start_codon:yes stop_codon:yes gene_type:complete